MPKQVKSISGFETGNEELERSFYSSMRQSQEADEEVKFSEPKTLSSQEYVKRLRKHHEKLYSKKYAYERGQFHQSIPHPDYKTFYGSKADAMITV